MSTSIDRQLTLLRMAARTDPHLRQAVADVDDETSRLEAENAALRDALDEIANKRMVTHTCNAIKNMKSIARDALAAHRNSADDGGGE